MSNESIAASLQEGVEGERIQMTRAEFEIGNRKPEDRDFNSEYSQKSQTYNLIYNTHLIKYNRIREK